MDGSGLGDSNIINDHGTHLEYSVEPLECYPFLKQPKHDLISAANDMFHGHLAGNTDRVQNEIPIPTCIIDAAEYTEMSECNSPRTCETKEIENPISTPSIGDLTQAPSSNARQMQPVKEDNMKVKDIERKRRMGNKVSAEKYRSKKLSEFKQSKERMAQLKCKNQELRREITKTQDELIKIKMKIMSHRQCGCDLLA